jgi:arsenate reductase-like glutaredoxin family protein|tara:strand:+ start:853 stop:1125 length:273 start_codon:yes stop_codon:yes gene_type:complete
LEANKIAIAETVSANTKLQAVDAKDMLTSASKLIAMKGKKIVEFDVKNSVSQDAVQAMLGPTGNMRAPTLRVGKSLLVGFNEEVFSQKFG